MARRAIVQIDETKCNGCGQCVPACAEGAIRIVDGKARLVADVYCDGLGACLGHCPQGAITITEREAAAFDEAAVHSHKTASSKACPGAAMLDMRLPLLPTAALATLGGRKGDSPHLPERPEGCFAQMGTVPFSPPPAETAPALCHWPIQLHLVPAHAPFLRGADLCLVADCVPFACADFHSRILRGRPVVIACPKLDDGQAYVDKLADMFAHAEIRSLTVVHMEVPCCTNLLRIAAEARRRAGSAIAIAEVIVSRRGEIMAGSPPV